jgi:hypothetical protein
VIQILFWVFLVLWIVLRPWPGAPWSNYTWAGDIIAILLFILLGIAVFGFQLR